MLRRKYMFFKNCFKSARFGMSLHFLLAVIRHEEFVKVASTVSRWNNEKN